MKLFRKMERRSPQGERERLVRYTRSPPATSNAAGTPGSSGAPPFISQLHSPPRSFSVLDPLPPLAPPSSQFKHIPPVSLRPIHAQSHAPGLMNQVASHAKSEHSPPQPFSSGQRRPAHQSSRHHSDIPAQEPPKLPPHSKTESQAQQPPRPPEPSRSSPQGPRSPRIGLPLVPENLAANPGKPSASQFSEPVNSEESAVGPPQHMVPATSLHRNPPASAAKSPSQSPPFPGPVPAQAPFPPLIGGASEGTSSLAATGVQVLSAGSSRILQSVHALQRMPHYVSCPAPLSDDLSSRAKPTSPGVQAVRSLEPSSRTPPQAHSLPPSDATFREQKASPVREQVKRGNFHGGTLAPLPFASQQGLDMVPKVNIDVAAAPAYPSSSLPVSTEPPKSEPVLTQRVSVFNNGGSGSVQPVTVTEGAAGGAPPRHDTAAHPRPVPLRCPLPPLTAQMSTSRGIRSELGVDFRSSGPASSLQPLFSVHPSSSQAQTVRPGGVLLTKYEASSDNVEDSAHRVQSPMPARAETASNSMKGPERSSVGIPNKVIAKPLNANPDNRNQPAGQGAVADGRDIRSSHESNSRRSSRDAVLPLYPGGGHTPIGLHSRPPAPLNHVNSVPKARANAHRIPGEQDPEGDRALSSRPLETAHARSVSGSDPSGAQRGQLKVEHALAYLEQVKTQFGDKIEVYNRFLDIMKAFKAQTIDTTEVIVRVSQLFLGHSALVLGFNRFLPPGYKIRIDKNETTGAFSAGFEGPEGYSALPSQRNATLLPISPSKEAVGMGSPGSMAPKRKDTTVKMVTETGSHSGSFAVAVGPSHVNEAVVDEQPSAALEENGNDNEELPPSMRLADAPMARNSPANNTLTSPADAKTKPLRNFGLSEFVPGMDVPPSERHVKGFEKALSFMNAVKNRSSESSNLFKHFMEIFSRFGHDERGLGELRDSIADLFANHQDLLEQFNGFLPVIFLDKTTDGTGERRPGHSSSTKGKQSMKLSTSTTSGLAFLGRSKSATQELAIFEYIRDKLGRHNAHIYADFIKCISLLTLEILTKDDVLAVASDLFKDCPAAIEAFTQYLAAAARDDFEDDGDDNSSSTSSIAEPVNAETLAKYKERPISETAADSKIMGTKSYRGLPRSFPKLVCSGRSSLEKITLNSTWVSVTQGSEEYSAKFMRKNSFEDNLYRCEDDRYELDMVIETNAATIMQLEPIALTMTGLPNDIKPMHALVDGALNRIHYNAIQRIYGEQGQEVVTQVKLNPSVAIPVVLARLKEKDVHWRRARNEMNRIWRDVGEKNYCKGIDHRSTVFKNFDKKELSSKALLLDILDPGQSELHRENEMSRARGFALPAGSSVVNDRSRAVRAVAKNLQNSSVPSSPTLELEYRDTVVHRSAFEVIKLAVLKDANDACSQKSTVRCLRKFLTSFFGVSFEEDDGGVKPGPAVLYGDESVYVMLRLYDYVYERLAVARAGALKMAADQRMRNTMNKKGRERVGENSHIPHLTTPPASLVQSFTPTRAHSHFRVEKLSENGEELYEEFLRLFKGVLMGKEDVGKFEDRCRIIIGPSSFVLFTLDKLVSKTARQVCQVCSSESSSRPFLDLHQEMRSRTKTPVKDANDAYWEGMEALYCAAVGVYLLREKGEKVNVFRMQYLKKDDQRGILSISVVAKTTTEEHEKKRLAAASELGAFIGFNSLWDVSNSKGRKGFSGGRNIPGSDSAARDRMEGMDGRGEKRKSTGVSKQVQKRSRSASDVHRRFLPVQVASEVLVKRDVVVKNELEMRLNSGQLVYISGGCDFLINRNKLWNKASGRDLNQGSPAAIKVRKLLGIGSSERDVCVTKEKSKAHVAVADGNSTESSSGDISFEQDCEKVSQLGSHEARTTETISREARSSGGAAGDVAEACDLEKDKSVNGSDMDVTA